MQRWCDPYSGDTLMCSGVPRYVHCTCFASEGNSMMLKGALYRSIHAADGYRAPHSMPSSESAPDAVPWNHRHPLGYPVVEWSGSYTWKRTLFHSVRDLPNSILS
jgi:hypothetical protein